MTYIAGTKNKLTADEIIRIIKASGEAQVVLLKLGDLYVRFGALSAKPVVEVETPPPVAEMTEFPKQAVVDDASEFDELKMRDEQIAHMLVEDPVRAEELLMKGEFEKNGGESGIET